MAHVVTGVVRRGGRAVRSLGPATVAVAPALIIGAAGVAHPATGGALLPRGGDTTTEVAATGALGAGTYYVSATAMLFADGTTPVYCRISGAPTNWGGGSGSNYIQAAQTPRVSVPANTVLADVCYAFVT